MHTKRDLSADRQGRQGEIATILTVASLVVMAVGLFLGSTRKPDSTRSRAAEDCLYNATAQVVKNTKNGPLITLAENNGKGLSVANDWGQGGPFINTADGYQYNFTQNPFTFGPYDKPEDTGSVTLKGLDENIWRIKGIFCTPQTPEARGCELGVSTTNKFTIDNFRISCGVHIKYGWVVESKFATDLTPIVTTQAKPSPAPTFVAAATRTPTPTATPTHTPTPTPTATPTHTPTPTNSVGPIGPTTFIRLPSYTPTPSPIPTSQQAFCNTAITAGRYSPDANVKFWEMGNKAGTVYVSYGMYEEKDKLEITHDEIDVFHTDGFVSSTKSNIPISYVPNASTKLKAKLTSSDKQHTIWWYALSCPRDPIPTTTLCTSDVPVKSISGSIKLDPQIAEACKNSDCVVTVSLEQPNTGRLVRQVRGPDFYYSFGAVKVEPGTHIVVDGIKIPNKPSGINETAIPSNCFAPRKIREHDVACGIDMSKELDCRATDVDFMVTNFGRSHTTPQNPLRAIDINSDRRINIVDLGLVLKEFGSKTKQSVADINNDGVVNTIDVARVIGNLSKSVLLEQ